MNAKFVAKTSKDGQIQGLATNSAPALYFYHPGSTAMVTDLDGHITQNVVYIPYGEVFVEERNGSWASSYLFNAKELDEETGLYYYGARYLNPSIALWLSTDPLQGKYPGMSPYNYCAGNPVKMVDPDGKVVWFAPIIAKGVGEFFVGYVVYKIYDYYHSSSKKGEKSKPTIEPSQNSNSNTTSNNSSNKNNNDNGNHNTRSPLSYERQKAVREAWKAEKELVEKTGKGTRVWTKAEKDELLKTGKVKDYIGQHIKSVKGHPESAGNKNNIEFIKNSEHLQKHNGNFRSPTDGDFIDRTIQH